ncbi:putative ABC transport system permease protein [Geodermatophilus dictyosporus]|uniref:Putative ABC transport system permease protein n=1 Tax=Geodermatophilus dictyosporus TaxID=1523247 RepID=A0A1I5SB02_9ACTN|nr:ABC transporter permease [Geodermatophilus dictyosporus]SFP67893.1 putative ABC transport system permease protein [Geodermatophilus dictyosporus]
MTGPATPPSRTRRLPRPHRPARLRRPRRPVATPVSRPVAPADRFRFPDLLGEATADIGSRPGRLVMTIVGTVLGITALVATIGLAQTTAAQIARQFDANAVTQLVVTPRTASTGGGTAVAATALPWDAVPRLERLAGIESAALLAEVPLPEAVVTAVPVNDPSQPPSAPPPVYAASDELLDTLGGQLSTGRFFDAGHDLRADRVAVLGARAAERLGVLRVDTQPSVFIDGVAYAVVGVVASVDARAELLGAVILPTGTARADFGLPAPGDAQARIAIGAGPQLRTQAALALAPDDPESLEVNAPDGRSELGRDVQADVNEVFVVLSVIVLLAGGVGIANVTTLSVVERVGEIGLRRAIGATGRQIAGQFVAESVVVGLLGGLIGSALGVFTVVGISVVRDWTPVVDPWIALGGALLGAVVGLVAGGLPARRAARIEPVDALRGGT